MPRQPPVYKLKDYDGEILGGTFYEHELQRVTKADNVYRVDRILQTRTINGRKEHFVSWKNYPAKFNSWVNEKDIKSL